MLASLGMVDWTIVLVCVGIAVGPGFLVRKYVQSQADFLVAGRTLSVFLATATLSATEMGLVTVMYMAQQGFLHGFSAFTLGLLGFGAFLFVGFTGFLVWGFRVSGATTFSEYYEKRYGRGVRLLGGLVLAAAGILNYGVFLKVEANFVRLMTDIPDLELVAPAAGWSVPLPALELIMTILMVVVVSYTLLGGMVSVVITDYIQFIILSFGMGLATYFVLTNEQIGGFEGLAAAVTEHRPGYGMNPFKTMEVGGKVLGMGTVYVLWQFLTFLSISCWQTTAFRTAAADSPRTARRIYGMTSFAYFGRIVIPMIWGVAALAYFSSQTGGLEGVVDIEAMPRCLAAILPTGAAGILMAGMLAALMSTHSSYLLAFSGVLVEDLLAPVLAVLFGFQLKDRGRLWITRLLIVCLGVYLVVFGLWYEVKSDIWSFLALTGTMYFAGAATLLGFGLYWRRANICGAYTGLIAGAVPAMFLLVLHIITLIIEPAAIKVEGHVPMHWVAQMGAHLTEAWIGLVSYPLAVTGMIAGSILYERRRRGGGVGAAAVEPEGGGGRFETKTIVPENDSTRSMHPGLTGQDAARTVTPEREQDEEGQE